MSDRELLELAAKAEGHGVEYDPISGLYFYNDKFTGLLWNPLTDDGDALRLAVKLEISVEFGSCLDDAPVVRCYSDLLEGKSEHPNFPDPYAATRRAIVRAAAEIGKEMK